MKAILPIRNLLGISQPMYGSTSHLTLKAIDFGWNTEYDCTKLYAPFDGKVVARLSSSSNTIAFQSNEKVEYVDGTYDYMTVITCHDNNPPKLGSEFKQGELYSAMGTAGGVPLHCHLEVQKGKYQNYTEIRNTSASGKYSSYIFPNTIEPYKALFVKDGTKLGQSATYNWVFESSNPSRVEFKMEDGYEYKWSVDGNKFGDKYDITSMGGFGDTELLKAGWEEVLAVNGSLFYTYDNAHYACGLEKSRGTNNQDISMSAVSDYNSCLAIAGIGKDLWYGSQEWIINNKLNDAYCAITALGLRSGGVDCNASYYKGFESQYNVVSGRTIIGEKKDGTIVSISFAGETGKTGKTGKQCLDLVKDLENAIMLDGGGSVWRRINGKVDISTTRKVKNALILYRRKVTEPEPEPTVDYEKLYNELLIKYNDQVEKNKELMKENDVLQTKIDRTISDLKIVIENLKED